MRKILTVSCIIILSCSLIFANNKRAFTIDDYFKVKEISGIQISPDGRFIAYVSNPEPNNLYKLNRVWLVPSGGCMTTWIVGNTDRFAAAVGERFVVDNFSSFGVDDTAYWYEKDFGLPYDEKNFTQYRKTSPILYIKNCTTPILIMQCMKDHRCPLPQALQFYMGLKKLKSAETQLVLYPRESHGIKEIPHQSDRLQRIVAWFDRYMKK